MMRFAAKIHWAKQQSHDGSSVGTCCLKMINMEDMLAHFMLLRMRIQRSSHLDLKKYLEKYLKKKY